MLALATIAFNKPRLIEEQQRLLAKHLQDDFALTVFDASSHVRVDDVIDDVTGYLPLGTNHHDAALNVAADELLAGNDDYIGFLDHDIFPTRTTTLVDKIESAGFYGVGQRHAPTGRLYLWPGFCFFSREWLDGRELDFTGIRADNPADNGDTGSGMWPLFEGEPWENMYRPTHSYQPIREPDGYGLQSFGVEFIGDWLHLSNGSGWMAIPDPDERERLTYEMISAL